MPEPDPSAALRTSSGATSGVGNVPGDPPPFPVPDHTLIRRVGRGAYGEVWLARNTLGTWRAVKFVRRSTFDDDRPFEREFAGIQRFEPISRSHESQLNILHVGRAEDGFYYVMELADDMGRGQDIDETTYTPRNLRSELHLHGRLPVSECLRLGLALTTALEHLHKHGLVHRDIKPSNIVFVNGIPKLADIGLVARAEATISFVGTEGFLPPEGPGTLQADIYSLGKVLYEISTGHDRQQFPELPTNIVELPDRAELSELNEVLLKACHRDPQERYQTAAEMHADLALLQSGRSVVRLRGMERKLRFVQRAGAAVTALAALAAGLYLWQARQTKIVRKLASENLTLAQRADANAKLAQNNEATARERLYAADVNLAHRALQVDNLRLARSLLQNHIPQAGQPDLRGFEWRYLWHQCRSEELFSIQAHTNPTPVFAFAPDGQRIVVCGRDGITKVLHLGERREFAILQSTDTISSVSFIPGGKLMATGSSTEVRLWDAGSFAELRRLPDAAAPVIFSPDGKFLLTGRLLPTAELGSRWNAKQTLMAWDTTNWSVIRSNTFPASGPRSIARDLYLQLAFGTDPGRLAVLVGDTIRVVSSPELKQLRVLPDKLQIGRVARPFLALSPDNHTLAYPSQKRYGIELWDLDSNRELRVLQGHPDVVFSAAFSPDGATLATCSLDQTIKLWKVDTGELVNTFRGQADEVWDVAFSPDGHLLASLGNYDAVVKLWDPTTRTRRESFRDSLNPLGFDVDGGLLAIQKPERDAVVLDPATFEVSPVEIPELREEARYTLSLNSVSSDGRFLAVWGRDQEGLGESFVEVWDRREAKRLCKLAAISPVVSFAPTRKLIATLTTNRLSEVPTEVSTTIWQLPLGTTKWAFPSISVPLQTIASGEEHLVTLEKGEGGTNAFGFGDRLRLWRIHADTVKPVLTISGVIDAVLSPDGRLLATAEVGGIKVRILPTGNVVGVLKGHTRKMPRLAFTPDGRTLASIADDRTLRLWHIATQRELLQFQASDEDQGPYVLEFSPDGRALAASRVDQQGQITWLYYAPSFAEIAVAEDRDYRAELGEEPVAWYTVAKALVRKQRWQEAKDAFDGVLKLTANRDDFAWLRTNALRQRAEVLNR